MGLAQLRAIPINAVLAGDIAPETALHYANPQNQMQQALDKLPPVASPPQAQMRHRPARQEAGRPRRPREEIVIVQFRQRSLTVICVGAGDFVHAFGCYDVAIYEPDVCAE